MTFFQKLKDKSSYINALKLFAVVVLAFFTGLLFRRSAGLLAMFPLAFILCGISAFITVNAKIKLTVFGVMVFFLNTIETEDMGATLTFTALCLLACLLFELSAKLIRDRKKSGYYVTAASVVICLALSLFFIGNPISAIKANNDFKNFAADKYLNEERGGSEYYSFTNIYYNHKTGAFEFQASSSKFPTDKGLISITDGIIHDGFESIVQRHLTSPYVTEITTVLRERFPTDSFTVTADGIYHENQKEIIAADDNELYGKIDFEIMLSGVQTANDMERKVRQYTEVLDNAGIKYGRIIYKGGTSHWVRRTATVTSQRPMGNYSFTISRVPVFTSNLFNRFSKSTSDIDLTLN